VKEEKVVHVFLIRLCCGGLQCVAVCEGSCAMFSSFFCVAVCCSVRKELHISLISEELRINARTATLCKTLQHSAAHCNTMQHSATQCNTM